MPKKRSIARRKSFVNGTRDSSLYVLCASETVYCFRLVRRRNRKKRESAKEKKYRGKTGKDNIRDNAQACTILPPNAFDSLLPRCIPVYRGNYDKLAPTPRHPTNLYLAPTELYGKIVLKLVHHPKWNGREQYKPGGAFGFVYFVYMLYRSVSLLLPCHQRCQVEINRKRATIILFVGVTGRVCTQMYIIMCTQAIYVYQAFQLIESDVKINEWIFIIIQRIGFALAYERNPDYSNHWNGYMRKYGNTHTYIYVDIH